VIRNSSNALVSSSSVAMRISILQGSPTGTEVYKEIYNPNPQTNANGLVSLEIGGGIPVTGTFSGIDWSAGPYYIKTETDPTGGTNYTITGTSQLLSVPFALYSKNAAAYNETDPVFGSWNKTTGINITASQVSDFQSSVTNNVSMLANTAKITNATHTGDATGSIALTVVGLNGTPLSGLSTGILKNTTGTGIPTIAIAGTDYLTPAGSAALLTNFPTLNQNTTGTASNVTGIVALTNGGTGASTAAAARTNLGLGSLATFSTIGSTEITNASILGADIAAATINSSNLATGSVTSTNILDGTITTADVANIDLSKISGLAANYVPRSTGTGLGGGILYDNGTNLGVGTTAPTQKLSVNGGITANSFLYNTAQTCYLSIPSSVGVYRYATPLISASQFTKYISDASGNKNELFYQVSLPDGALILGIQADLYTINGTTSCTLLYGIDGWNSAILATASNSTVGNSWTWTPEATCNHIVSNSTYSYIVQVSTSATSWAAVGNIKIRYQVSRVQ
jgi:hypothetical protein